MCLGEGSNGCGFSEPKVARRGEYVKGGGSPPKIHRLQVLCVDRLSIGRKLSLMLFAVDWP